jgi:hypothetical protein|tara:strand:+ start:318 stop:485 length:168 start_codon:yes stop_codon:yes gene_type:complete
MDYNLILYIGIGLIVGGFCLFLYSQHRLRELDIEEWKNEQLIKSFNRVKEEEGRK